MRARMTESERSTVIIGENKSDREASIQNEAD